MNTPLFNLFEHLPDARQAEQFEDILRLPGIRIERIVSCGQSSPEGYWYDQSEGEWVMVLQGQGVIEFDDGRLLTLNSGDGIHIPPHCPHRVAATTDTTIWLAVFYGSPTPAQ